MDGKSADGFWRILTRLEASQSEKIVTDLKFVEQSVIDCYECGIEVPTLPNMGKRTDDIKIAALFLKRCLNDLRALWNLLVMGYSTQAGTIAAALFENALIINCVLSNSKRAAELRRSQSGHIPWTVADICKYHILEINSADNSSKDIEYQTACLYAHYVWLCMLKHPNMQSVLHDALVTNTPGEGYCIMASPDARKEDIPIKLTILLISINRLTNAIDSFSKACKIDRTNEQVVKWQKKFDSIVPLISNIIDQYESQSLPINIEGTRFLNKARQKFKNQMPQ